MRSIKTHQTHPYGMRRVTATRKSFALTLGAMLVASVFVPQVARAGGNNLPTGGQFAAGNGKISQSGNTLTVDQSSNRAIINWNGFSVGEAASARFNNGSGATLNRVTGNTASRIDGSLSSSGSVYLANPAGVVVGPKGTINTGGTFAASTHDVDNQQFMNGGDLTFKGNSQAQVINAGTIRSAQGDVALIARRVENRGTIEAPNGTVALAAGYEVLMRDAANADGTVSVKIGGGDTEALNSGAIQAAQAELRANGGNVYALAGNTQGVIKATGTASKGGRIFLTAGDEGTVQSTGTLEARQAGQGGTVSITGGKLEVAGTIDASATAAGGQGGTVIAYAQDTATYSGTIKAEGGKGGKGGFVETSAKKRVKVADTARVSTKAEAGQTGTWLIDPTDFTVSASGGDMSGATVAANLASTNFEIRSDNGGTEGSGSVYVNDAITWTSGNTLTLTAASNIEINAAITGRNGGLTLTPASTGTITTSAAGTVDVGTFTLTQGLWNQIRSTLPAFSARDFRVNDGATFVRLLGGNGSSGSPWLIGDVYGLQGLRGLSVAGGPDGSGFFSLANDVDATGTRLWNDGKGFSVITGFTGTFDGQNHVINGLTINRPDESLQGLFYLSRGANFRNLGLTNVSIVGNETIGGLVARLDGGGSISNVYVTGSVSGGHIVGGLVGLADQVTMQNVTSNATVTGTEEVGGLVGRMRAGALTNAYVTGSVTGTQAVGGLVGFSGLGYGDPIQGGALSNVYASGLVAGGLDTGALVGYSGDGTTLANGYFDIDTTGQLASAGNGVGLGGTALTNANAYSQSSYGTLDFTNTWFMLDGATRPMLRSEYSTTLHTAHQVQLMTMDLNAAYTLGNDIDMTATRTSSDVWSANRGFVSIGRQFQEFTGSLDGQGHVIDGLSVIGSSDANVGLFGVASNATVRRLGLTNVSIDAGGSGSYVGAVIGQQAGGLVEDVYVSGSVTGGVYTGGVSGLLSLGGIVRTSQSAATVTNTGSASASAGGLVGRANNASVSGSSATGDVSGSGWAGGLVGLMFDAMVEDSYANGSVAGAIAGGLAGVIRGSVSRSYATGSVTGTQYGGGLAGTLAGGSSITDAYAMGAVFGAASVGGLVAVSGGSITNAYATGYVSTNSGGGLGGLVGNTQAGHNVVSSYWNTQTSGTTISAGGSGMTTAQMQGVLLPGFDPSVWSTGDGLYPYLQWQFAAGETPKAVSGTAVADTGAPTGAGGQVILLSQGEQLGKGAIGANGYFYALTSSDAVSTGLLAYLNGLSQKGATFTDSGATTGLFVQTGALRIDTTAGSVSETMASLSTAMGTQAANTDLDFIGAVGGTNLATLNGSHLFLTASSDYLLDRSLSSAGTLSVNSIGTFGVSGSITLAATNGLLMSGNVRWTDAASLSLVSGQAMMLNSAFDGQNGTLSINAGQDILLIGDTAVNVDTFRLTGPGAWRQVGGSLPDFYARDFQLDVMSGTQFLRAQSGLGTEASPYQLFDVYGLQGIVAGGGHYALAGDIDASGTADWNAGEGFAPIQAFDGVLDGGNHTIDGLTIATQSYSEAGLFGSLSDAQIRNLALTNVSVRGGLVGGGLVATMMGGSIDNVSVSGQVSGSLMAGGLAGYLREGSISNSQAGVQVSALSGPVLGAGGLVGYLDAGVIRNSHATGAVQGEAGADANVGGLVGLADQSTIEDAYATGNVTVQGSSFSHGGGLVGVLADSTIDRSFARGNVSGSAFETNDAAIASGGLVGIMEGASAIRQAYATGSVSNLSTGVTNAVTGGLVGVVSAGGGTISNAYATGAVSSASNGTGTLAGGLVGGLLDGSIVDSYATGHVSGAAASMGGLVGGLTVPGSGTPATSTVTASFWLDDGSNPDNGIGTGITLAQFRDLSTFTDAGWDIDSVGGTGKAWRIYDGYTGPLLRTFLTGVTVTADDASKTYDGQAYSGFTYSKSDNTAALLGTLGSDLTNANAGTYSIAKGLYSGQSGYDITMEAGTLTIGKRQISIEADDQTRSYGDANPALTYTVGGAGLVSGESLTGSLATSATSASGVGDYDITQGTLAASANYDVTGFTGGTLTIGKRALSIVADAASRDYGDANPGFTYVITSGSLVNADTLGGALATSATLTSGVGNYGITLGTLGNANYDITSYTGATLSIVPRAITIVADDQSRDYGDANPALTYTVGGRGLVNGDTLSGSLATLAGLTSNVGSYGITQGTLAASGNYDITGFTGGTLSIVPRAITIVADGQSRDYGDANPALTYTVGGRGLVNGDTLSGSLATLAGLTSNVGSYGITQGTLAASGNYDVTGFTGGTLSIVPRAITIVADDQSRDYGDANPVLTYTVGGKGLVNGDTLSGSLATLAGLTSNVGSYGISQGTLAASGNYNVSVFTPGTLSVGRRSITITADGLSRVYGDANPLLTYTVGGKGLVNGDALSGALVSSADLRSNVGSYGITQGTLAASANYDVSYSGANLQVTPRAIVVTADDQSKRAGQPDPTLSWAVTGGSLAAWDSLASVFAGQLAREAGDLPGNYAIGQGSLAASGNYALGFVPGVFTVQPGGLAQMPSSLFRSPFDPGSRPTVDEQQPGPQQENAGCGNGVAGGGVHPCNRSMGPWLKVSSR